MRLSDILKKSNQGKQPSASESAPARQDSPDISEKADGQPEVVLSDQKSTSIAAEEVYSKAIFEIKETITSIQKGKHVPGHFECIPGIIELTENQSEEIIVLSDRATPDIYLYGHSVNVCILSILLAQSAGMDKNKLADVGLCAILHDIGMIKYLNLALKNSRLSPGEYSQIKKHSAQGQEIVFSMLDADESIKKLCMQVIVQVHERKNGSGYPNSLKANEIHEFARIISVADVYEAQTHPRSYRDRILPHEALKTMVYSAEQEFQAELVKAFIERISLYPPGSYVRLNSEEIARVIGINRGLPTRPKVKVIIDPNLSRLPEPRILNLSTTPMFFVKDAIDETKLNTPDKKLSLEMKAIRWWVKGL